MVSSCYSKLFFQVMEEWQLENSLLKIHQPIFSPPAPLHICYLYFASLGKQSCLRKLLLFAFTHWRSWPTDQNSCSWPAHPEQPLKQRDSLLPSGRFRLCCWECPKYSLSRWTSSYHLHKCFLTEAGARHTRTMLQWRRGFILPP